MNFFSELKRRNVFRVGVAYAVAAWIVLQVSDLVLENINAPEMVIQVIMLLLGIGFPLVLIFAWAFEMTPEGVKRTSEVDASTSMTPTTGRKLDRAIIGILAVAVVYLLVDKTLLDRDAEPATETVVADASAAAVEAGPSVAVLPFVNMSGDTDNEYFSDGLTETLLHMLAQLPELRVAARTSSFAFKGKDTGIAEIAETLGVAHILEGSVQKSGQRVRVTAQLIRANDGFHVWSQNYTRPLEDIFAIQDEIARDVAGALDTSLLSGESEVMQTPETGSVAAYDLYLRALEQQSIDSFGSLRVAETLFKQALATDPEFDDARLSLVRNYMQMQGTGLIDEDTMFEYVEPLLEQVQAKHPENRLARAYELLLGILRPEDFLNPELRDRSMTELRNLLPLIPTETEVRTSVAITLAVFYQQPEEGLAVIEAGLMVDPLSPELYVYQGVIYRLEDRLDEAEQAFMRAAELAPRRPGTYSQLSSLAAQRNDIRSKLNWMRKAIEADPLDHELAADIANDMYALRLAEDGDYWARKVSALAPGSSHVRNLAVSAALSRNDEAEALALSQRMIEDRVDHRGGAFANAVSTYGRLMAKQGRNDEALEFLFSHVPEAANFSEAPEDLYQWMVRFFSIRLMLGVEPDELVASRWRATHQQLEATGFPLDDSHFYIAEGHILHGRDDEAAQLLLDEVLSEPVAGWITFRASYDDPLLARLLGRPEIAARFSEIDAEIERQRDQVKALLLEPEWQ